VAADVAQDEAQVAVGVQVKIGEVASQEQSFAAWLVGGDAAVGQLVTADPQQRALKSPGKLIGLRGDDQLFACAAGDPGPVCDERGDDVVELLQQIQLAVAPGCGWSSIAQTLPSTCPSGSCSGVRA
jgi:hypothetical protein